MGEESWRDYIGQDVVVDTDSLFVYLGTLARVDDQFIVLSDADVHDRRESPSTKEQYIMDAKRFGIKPNRREVSIRKALVVSVSRLDDVILY